MTGKTYTSFRTQQKKERPFRIIKWDSHVTVKELYARINQRVGTDDNGRTGRGSPAMSTLTHALNSLNTVGLQGNLQLSGR